MYRGLTNSRVKYISKLLKNNNDIIKKRLIAKKEFELKDDIIFNRKIEIDYKLIDYYDETSVDYLKEKNIAVLANSKINYLNNTNSNIIFCEINEAFNDYPDLIFKYFGKLIKFNENKYTCLNYASFTSGIFIYIPKNVDAGIIKYFRKCNNDKLGQIDHIIIVLEDNSKLIFTEETDDNKCYLHNSIVEVYLNDNCDLTYNSYENISCKSYNLEIKRAKIGNNSSMIWNDYNLGGKINIKYPSIILDGKNSSGSIHSLAISNDNQIHDIGSKMIHKGINSKSNIVSKLIANNGEANYRETVLISNEAINSICNIDCENLLLENGIGEIISNNKSSKESIINENISVIEDEELLLTKKKLIIDFVRNQIEALKNT